MNTRVLIIDDEIDICEMISEILTGHVDEIFTAQNAAMALEKIGTETFDLIISDVMMPKMTGLDLLKTLRSKKSKTPVVFVSASDEEETLVKALEYGAADFVAKPFDNNELIKVVKKMVAVGRLTRQAG